MEALDRTPALHEAGHAIAALTLNVPFDSVTIRPDGLSLGHSVLQGVTPAEDWFHDPSRECRDSVENRIIVVLAGPEAQLFRRERSNFLGGIWDCELARTLLKGSSLGAEGVTNYHDWLRERARTIVNGLINRRAIDRVASALIERQTITAQDVAVIIADCAKGLAR